MFSDSLVLFVAELSTVFSINAESFLRFLDYKKVYEIPDYSSTAYTYTFNVARNGNVERHTIRFSPAFVSLFFDWFLKNIDSFPENEKDVFCCLLIEFTRIRVRSALSRVGLYNQRNVEECTTSALEIVFNSNEQLIIDVPTSIEFLETRIREYEKTRFEFKFYRVKLKSGLEIDCKCTDSQVQIVKLAIITEDFIRFRTGINKMTVCKGVNRLKWSSAVRYACRNSVAAELGLADRKITTTLNHSQLTGAQWFESDPKGYARVFSGTSKPSVYLAEAATLEQIEENRDSVFMPSLMEVESQVYNKLNKLQKILFDTMVHHQGKITNEDLAIYMLLSMRQIKKLRSQIRRIAQQTMRRQINKNIERALTHNSNLKGGLEMID